MSGDTLKSRTRWGVRYPDGHIATSDKTGARFITELMAAQHAALVTHQLSQLHGGVAAVVVRRDELLLTGPWEETDDADR